ncbi:MAG: type II CRISPR-associated endonuclease Cas1 [Thermoguttaceae bacterium]
MPNRILDFSQSPTRLRTRLKQLIIEPENDTKTTVPFDDIAVILLSHPQMTLSQSVLESSAEKGVVLIACNRKSLPVGMFLPISDHHLPVRRFLLQTSVSVPIKKQTWQQVVRAKIISQACVLEEFFGNDSGLRMMATRVRSGDAGNLESQAARKYWKLLFHGHNFSRKPDSDDAINIRLNFGYGVLRGIVARAICACGLHPVIGIQHHNKYNPYCLADDLMEPFRPLIDRAVWTQAQKKMTSGLTQEVKSGIIEPLLQKYKLCGEVRSLFDIITHLAESLVHVFAKEWKELSLPESWEPFCDKPF